MTAAARAADGRFVRATDDGASVEAVPGALGVPDPPDEVLLGDIRFTAEDADPAAGCPIGLALAMAVTDPDGEGS